MGCEAQLAWNAYSRPLLCGFRDFDVTTRTRRQTELETGRQIFVQSGQQRYILESLRNTALLP